MMERIYHLTALVLALSAILISTQAAFADDSLNQILKKWQVTPSILQNVPDRLGTIRIELNGKFVAPGESVPVKNFKDMHFGKITWEVSNFDARHTLLFLDLDRKTAASGNHTSIYNQFTGLNIPGNIINAGQTIVAFDTPSVPCQKSMKHRMLMLAFHQQENIDISDVASLSAPSGHSSKRENFNLRNFIEKHRLDLVAANFFFAVGESNGVCSGSTSVHAVPSGLTALLALASVLTYNLVGRRSMLG